MLFWHIKLKDHFRLMGLYQMWKQSKESYSMIFKYNHLSLEGTILMSGNTFKESQQSKSNILFFLKKKRFYLFIHGRHREREGQRHRQREEKAPYSPAQCRTWSQDLGITTWAKSRRSTTKPPRCPQLGTFLDIIITSLLKIYPTLPKYYALLFLILTSQKLRGI